MTQLSLHSPIGDLTLFEIKEKLVAIEWGWGADQSPTPFLENAKSQLLQYFDGTLKTFDLKIAEAENPLHARIYKTMSKIPYGKTMTYGELAKIANTGARVVGKICGLNPIPIIVPCHRVMGANGKLTGYSGEGGVETKTALLTLEGVIDPKLPF